MKKLFFFVLFFLQSCSSHNDKKIFDFNFTEKMTFNEFHIKLDEYANNSQYPNINN